jgi:hypothetical protein
MDGMDVPTHFAGRFDRIYALEGQALTAGESPEGTGLEDQQGNGESRLCEHVAGLGGDLGSRGGVG